MGGEVKRNKLNGSFSYPKNSLFKVSQQFRVTKETNSKNSERRSIS